MTESQAEAVAGAPAPAPEPLAKAASRQAQPVADTPAPRGRSPVQLVAGVAAALVVVAGGYLMLGTPKAPPAETAAAEPAATAAAAAPEPASTATTAAAEAAPAQPVETAAAAPAAESAPDAEPATKAAETVALAPALPVVPAATETAAAPAPEPAAPDPVAEATEATAAPAETAATPAAPDVKPSANQVAFAAWDVAMPFSYDDRMVDGKRVAVVTRFQPGVDIKSAGDWLAPGVAIHAVNGMSIQSAGSLTVAVMNAMAVDPDGKARVVVEFTDSSRQLKTGLLTVDAIRLVSLQNGLAVRTLVVDGAWKTEVSAVARPETTTLQPGDTLFRDKTTTTPLDGATSLETILAALVDTGAAETEFSIIRDNKVGSARMQLARDGGQ